MTITYMVSCNSHSKQINLVPVNWRILECFHDI